MYAGTLNPTKGRSAALLVIAGLHAGVVVALASASAWREITHASPAIDVVIVQQPPRPVEPPRPIPLPNMRPPEIHIPAPPVENLFNIRMEETKPASAPPPVAAAVVVAAAAPTPEPMVQPPRGDIAYLNNPAPAYPAVSKKTREQGRVMLRVRVDEKGKVEDVRVESSSGFKRLDEAAREAVSQWRFLPARLGERAVAGWALVPINFQLRG
jgi:periplasmic protein TonB